MWHEWATHTVTVRAWIDSVPVNWCIRRVGAVGQRRLCLLVRMILVSVGVRRERHRWFRFIWKCRCDKLLGFRGERDDIDTARVYPVEHGGVIGLFPALHFGCLLDLEVARNR